MKKKIVKIVIGILFLVSLMFAEYRYIMHNICPYLGERGTVYLEIFGHTDEYYAEHIEDWPYKTTILDGGFCYGKLFEL